MSIANKMIAYITENQFSSTEIADSLSKTGDIPLLYPAVEGSYAKAKGIIVQGLMRDVNELRARKYPVWCAGYTPIGCVNKPTTPFAYEDRDALETRYGGCILVCDDCGVVAIPEKYQTEKMLRRLEGMRLQEDVWNYCIDELGWNTDRTICDKDYLNKPELLPAKYRDRLDLLQIKFGKEPGH